MTGRSVGELVGMPVGKKAGVLSHPGYQPAGSCDRPGMRVPDDLFSFLSRHIARHYTPSLSAASPPAFAVVQGPPGEGKTAGLMATCSRGCIDLIMVGPAEFAGETENASVVAVKRVAEFVLWITAREKRPIAVCLDDFDLSIVNRLGSTEYTVDSQLLTGELQHLADTGGIRTAQGVPVPIFLTGNDFTSMRGSLLRPGRAEFYEHTLSFDEKVAIVSRILETADRKAVAALVSAHRKEPVAFFSQLRMRALDEDLDTLIAHYGLNFEAIERELQDVGGRIDMGRLQKLAAAVASGRAKSFLVGR